MKFAMLKIDQITVEERARQDMGNLDELAYSIKQTGLIQPLAVREKNGAYVLLAGGRRLEAIRRSGAVEVGARIYNQDLTPLEAKTIELHENLYRKELKFDEDARLKREIHLLQQEIHGKAASGGRPEVTGEAGGWKMNDTADLLGVSQATISQDIKLADALDAFPELFEDCRTKTDASKVIKRMGNSIIREELARKAEADQQDAGSASLLNSFIIGDFFEQVKKVPDRSIDLIELDPPYAIKLKEVKQDYAYGTSYNEISHLKYVEFMQKCLEECYRTMAEHSWLVCWFAPEPWFDTIYNLLINTGFSVTRMCGIWIKPSGQSNQPTIRLANAYEMFFYARKGSSSLGKPGRTNVFDYSPVPPQQKSHPTERPIELMIELLQTFAYEGSRVMVPFLGSGNTILAAWHAKMNAFGFELTEDYRNSFVLKVNEL